MNDENKQNAIAYVRCDIALLSEQDDYQERHGFHHRAQAGLFAIHAGGLITHDELLALGQEIGEANEKAAKQCAARRLKEAGQA